MENVALWHERDISHSSRRAHDRPGCDDHARFRLARLAGVIDKLLVYPENMEKNLNKFRGLVHSQRVLLALTQAGVSREDAYRLVQRNAMKVWEQGKDFLEELLADAEVRAALSEEDIREKFDLGYHTKHVDTIFKRVFRLSLNADSYRDGALMAPFSFLLSRFRSASAFAVCALCRRASSPCLHVLAVVSAAVLGGFRHQSVEMLQILLVEILDADETVFGMARQDDLVELGLNRAGIARLGVLQHEDHQEGDDRRAGIDDQLPGFGISRRTGRGQPR